MIHPRGGSVLNLDAGVWQARRMNVTVDDVRAMMAAAAAWVREEEA